MLHGSYAKITVGCDSDIFSSYSSYSFLECLLQSYRTFQLVRQVVISAPYRPSTRKKLPLSPPIPLQQMIRTSSSNSTVFGMTRDVERFIWGGWLVIILVVSILGNTTILLASVKFNTFKLHKVIVTFISHIAVCDLLVTIFNILSQTISIFADDWILGSWTCYLRAYISPYCNSVSLYLVCGMTVLKLILLKYPLKARTWTRRHAHISASTLWFLSLYSPLMALLVDKHDVYYDKGVSTCFFAFTSSTWEWLLPISVVFLSLIPTLLTVITSVLLVKHLLYARIVAKRTQGSVPWQGIVTVVLSATVYCVSFLPVSMYFVVKSHLEMKESLQVWFRVGDTFKYFNVVGSFFIYNFAVFSFRTYVKLLLQKIVGTFDIHSRLKNNGPGRGTMKV